MTQQPTMDWDSSWRAIGISNLSPGFYDEPSFRVAEQTQFRFLLDVYATYVKELAHSEEYRTRARKVITDLTSFLYPRLEDAGSRSECVFVSQMLSRILDAEGIWNVVIAGGFLAVLKTSEGVTSFPFCPRDDGSGNDFEGHAWLFAPPFNLIDLTAWLQPYPGSILRARACPLLQEVVEQLSSDDFPDDPARTPFATAFPPLRVRLDGAEFRYAPRAIRPSRKSLEQLDRPVLVGK